MQRVHVFVQDVVRLGIELAALVPIGLVRKRRANHSIGDLVAVHRDLQLGLQLRELLGVIAREVSEVPLAGEAPQLPDARAAVHGHADRQGLV